jgi:hypothetical protein
MVEEWELKPKGDKISCKVGECEVAVYSNVVVVDVLRKTKGVEIMTLIGDGESNVWGLYLDRKNGEEEEGIATGAELNFNEESFLAEYPDFNLKALSGIVSGYTPAEIIAKVRGEAAEALS